MKRYVLQFRTYPSWNNKWEAIPSQQFDTLEEAREAFDRMPSYLKPEHRIAETYTVVRYKPVK